MNAVVASLSAVTAVLASAPRPLCDGELSAIDFTQPDGAGEIREAVRARDAALEALRAAISPHVVTRFAELLRSLAVDEGAVARLTVAGQQLTDSDTSPPGKPAEPAAVHTTPGTTNGKSPSITLDTANDKLGVPMSERDRIAQMRVEESDGDSEKDDTFVSSPVALSTHMLVDEPEVSSLTEPLVASAATTDANSVKAEVDETTKKVSSTVASPPIPTKTPPASEAEDRPTDSAEPAAQQRGRNSGSMVVLGRPSAPAPVRRQDSITAVQRESGDLEESTVHGASYETSLRGTTRVTVDELLKADEGGASDAKAGRRRSSLMLSGGGSPQHRRSSQMFSSPAQRRKSSMMAGRQGSRDFAFGRAGSRELGGGSKAIARMSFSSRGSSSSAPGRDTAEPEITTSITEEVATIDESRRAHPWAPATTTALTAGTVGAHSGGSAKVAPELSVTQASGSVKSEVSVAAPEPSRRRPSVTIPMEPVVPPQSPEMERRPSILPSFTHAVASGVQRGLRRVQSELSLAPRSDNGGEGGENKPEDDLALLALPPLADVPQIIGGAIASVPQLIEGELASARRQSSAGMHAHTMHCYNEEKDLRKLMLKTAPGVAVLRRRSQGAAMANVGRVAMPVVQTLVGDVVNEHRKIMIRCSFPFVLVPPEAWILDAWNMLILLLVLCQSVTVPLEAAFSEQMPRNGTLLGSTGDNIVLAFFVADMMFNFVLVFPNPENGELVTSASRIAKRYIFSVWFVIDFISIFPFERLASRSSGFASSVKLTKVFKLTRMVRLGKVMRRVKRIAHKTLHLVSGSTKKAVQLFKLLAVMLFVMHWVACGWNFVGSAWRCDGLLSGSYVYEDFDAAQVDEGETITQSTACSASKFDQTTFWALYTSCLFQTCQSLFGSGYAFEPFEQTYFALVIIIGAVMQASVFGSVAQLLYSLNEDQHAYQHKCDLIQYKMDFLRVPEKLQNRVLLYYENMWQ